MSISDIFRSGATYLIEHAGDKKTVICRQYQTGGSPTSTKRGRTLIQTVTGVSAMSIADNVLHIDGWEMGDEMMMLSAEKLPSVLSGDWTIEDERAVERPISGDVQSISPGANPIWHLVHLKTGTERPFKDRVIL